MRDPEIDPITEEVCPECEGWGSFEIQQGEADWDNALCPLCDGRGFVPRNSIPVYAGIDTDEVRVP